MDVARDLLELAGVFARTPVRDAASRGNGSGASLSAMEAL
jgi:hypothetical protein